MSSCFVLSSSLGSFQHWEEVDYVANMNDLRLLEAFLIGTCLQNQLQNKRWLLARMHRDYIYHVVRQNIPRLDYDREYVERVLDYMLQLDKAAVPLESEAHDIAGDCVICASEVSTRELHPWCSTCTTNQPVHAGCLSEWLCHHPTCPTCRDPLHMIGFVDVDPEVIYYEDEEGDYDYYYLGDDGEEEEEEEGEEEAEEGEEDDDEEEEEDEDEDEEELADIAQTLTEALQGPENDEGLQLADDSVLDMARAVQLVMRRWRIQALMAALGNEGEEEGEEGEEVEEEEEQQET